MKPFLYFSLAVIILGGVCVATCPDHDAHSEALKNLLNKTLTVACVFQEPVSTSDFNVSEVRIIED